MNIQVTFFGTGSSQGIPVVGSNDPVCLSSDSKDKRLRSSALVECINPSGKKVRILIDCGPDFRQQMLTNNKSLIDAVLITHEHNDHVAGLDDLRPLIFRKGEDMPVYGLHRVLEHIKSRFDYAFTEIRYPGTPRFDLYPIDYLIDSKTNLYIQEINITPIPIMHGKLPIVGYRIGNLAYVTDAHFIPEESIKLLKGLDCLIINALQIEKHPVHFNLEEALEMISILQPKKSFIIHITYKMGFHEEVQKMLPENVFLAYDTLSISL